jgi:RHS repeat-associated protein
MSGSGYTMSYDEDGNLATKNGPGLSQTFNWNSLGQLTSVTTNGTTVTFGYDGLGRRVRKTVNGATTGYLYAGQDLFMDLDASGNPVTEYAYWPSVDAPFAMAKSGQTYYFTQDPTSNNIAGLVRASDNSLQAYYAYTPFGAQRSGSFDNVGNSLQFAARQYDAETGLLYFRARYYDPQFGRFVSEDPIGLNGGINPYVYALNDPLNGSDPYGLDSCAPSEGPGSATGEACLPPVTTGGDGQPCDEACVISVLGGGNGGGASAGADGGGGGDGSPAPAPPPPGQKAERFAKKLLQCTLDHYGLTALGASLAAAGANVIGTRGKFAGATPGTSVASLLARNIFGDLKFPGGIRLPTLTGFPGIGQGLRVFATDEIGVFVGRAVPVVGYALLAYDAFRIGQCVAKD